MQIRPASDLQDKYTEIEDEVLKSNGVVYLTKNGYGSMVLMSLEKYSEFVKEIEVDLKEYPNFNKEIELEVGLEEFKKYLDSSEKIKKETHKKALDNAKKIIDK